MSHLVAPSILAADFSNLQRDIEMVNASAADWFHLDVMDGMFVPNITFGQPVIKAIKHNAAKPLDIHLMIENPDRYLKSFVDAGADVLTVHYEACTHLHRTLHAIREMGILAGVAVNPHTVVSLLADIIDDTDLVCVMSVNPGFGGQHFIENTYHKIRQLKQMISERNSSAKIEVDGGVGPENAAELIHCGSDVLVAGNAVFGAHDPAAIIKQLKNFTN